MNTNLERLGPGPCGESNAVGRRLSRSSGAGGTATATAVADETALRLRLAGRESAAAAAARAEICSQGCSRISAAVARFSGS